VDRETEACVFMLLALLELFYLIQFDAVGALIALTFQAFLALTTLFLLRSAPTAVGTPPARNPELENA